MTLTVAVLLACLAAYLLKLAGYIVPARLVAGERTSRITTLLPVAMLAALVAVQTFGQAGRLVLDARIVAVAFAVVLLRYRANFLVVVFAAAAVAATVRALGWLP